MERGNVIDENHDKCKNHGELLEYFCGSCEEAVCVVCTCGPQHEQHCDNIVDFETGQQESKMSLNQLQTECNNNARKVEDCAEMVKLDLVLLQEYKKDLSVQCENIETVLTKMKQQINFLSALEHPVVTAYREINTHLVDVRKHKTEINNLIMSSVTDCIQQTKECQRSCDRIRNDTQKILNTRIRIPEYINQKKSYAMQLSLKQRKLV